MRPRLTLINRDYTRLWFGQAVSSVGDAVFSTTLVLWVATVLAKDESWAPMAVSGVLMASSVAVLGIGPLAGVFVDRWDKLATLLRTEVVRGALVVVLTAVSFLPVDALPAGVWLALVYATVLLLHAAGQFFSPARFAILADLVKGDADRARAAGIGQATGETAWIIGPPLAAPLLFAAGIQWALLFNALSYAVSYVAIRSIDLPAPAAPAGGGRTASEPAPNGPNGSKPTTRKPSLGREFAEGVRFFARSRFLVVLLLLAVIGQFGLGALSTLNVFFTTDNLNADAHLYGYIGMAMGVGGIAGALSGGRVVQWLGARRSTWISLLVSGVLLVAYSRQTTFLGGIALLFVFTVPLTVLNTAMAPLLLAAAPPDLRGRVMAVFYPVTKLASMLAAVLSGWLAGSVLTDVAGSFGGVRFGPIDTIFAVSGAIVVLSGVFAWLALPGTGTAGKEPGEDAAGGPGEPAAKGAGEPGGDSGGEPVGEATETEGATVGGTAAERAVALTADVTSPAGPRGHRSPDHERGRPE
ncbi:MFS family permease [Streptomyces sp. PvR006]|uniref:MFS transporter n=1 Tax=Streptomyces sp. PvR006 TaxID=2817860 RepID=UPI001AE107CE|nr:MFS transporter [Streptomyces sp. PvR006]MBP2580405.1 MFS family permease [Streptomyces sp. PvR006]